eukprot:1317366-Amphidinium_carterae.1
MILASGARGPGFNSQNSPFSFDSASGGGQPRRTSGRVGKWPKTAKGRHRDLEMRARMPSLRLASSTGSKPTKIVAQAVRVVWLLVAPNLKDRPEAWPRAQLPAPAEDTEALVRKDHID